MKILYVSTFYSIYINRSQLINFKTDARIWPRAAALAERLWSDPITIDYDEAETRLNTHRKRLIDLGLTPDALRPEWCLQNEGQCKNYH